MVPLDSVTRLLNTLAALLGSPLRPSVRREFGSLAGEAAGSSTVGSGGASDFTPAQASPATRAWLAMLEAEAHAPEEARPPARGRWIGRPPPWGPRLAFPASTGLGRISSTPHGWRANGMPASPRSEGPPRLARRPPPASRPRDTDQAADVAARHARGHLRHRWRAGGGLPIWQPRALQRGDPRPEGRPRTGEIPSARPGELAAPPGRPPSRPAVGARSRVSRLAARRRARAPIMTGREHGTEPRGVNNS